MFDGTEPRIIQSLIFLSVHTYSGKSWRKPTT